MGRLEGKRAFITGAGNGIGEAGALLFAREGAHVACADIRHEDARRTADKVLAAGGKAVAVKCDVTQETDVENAISETIKAFGSLEVVWANAGISSEGKATDIDMNQWQRCMAVNLTGPWLTAKYALPYLTKRGGSLIFTSSASAIRGVPNTFAYAVAKSGINGMAMQIAMEYAQYGVRANVVLPGLTMTPILKEVFAARAKQLGISVEQSMERLKTGDAYPLMRSGMPEDQANAALFFASDESSWITGHLLPVEGGRAMKW